MRLHAINLSPFLVLLMVGCGGHKASDAGSRRDSGPRPDAGPPMSGFISGCRIFPADNAWNQNISSLPMHPRASQILAQMHPILADNGSDWYISGDSDDRWDAIIDDVIRGLRAVHGSDFEIVDTGASIPQSG